MGCAASDYPWSSNDEVAKQGIALVQAYRLSGAQTYLLAALTNLNYLLGRNATGYCFVTGSGTRLPQHPRHHPSEADGVAVPSLLVSGPNPGRQGPCIYSSLLPPLAYGETVCAYASNKITINWQVTLAGLPARVKVLRVHVTDKNRGNQEQPVVPVDNGKARFTLTQGSYATLMSE